MIVDTGLILNFIKKKYLFNQREASWSLVEKLLIQSDQELFKGVNTQTFHFDYEKRAMNFI